MLLQVSPALTAYIIVITAVIGLVAGSFLNCLAWRIVHGESIMRGRSHCPACGHVLGVRDLVPLFSWVASKGRCRYCRQRISVRYPLAELLCALAFVAIVLRYDASLEAVELACFTGVLLVLSLTDIDEYLIPNGCIVAALAIRVIYIVSAGWLYGLDTGSMLVESLIGGVAIVVPLFIVVLVADRLMGRDSMGGGDLKLFFVAGVYFGWRQCLFLIIAACIIGIVAGLAVPAGSAPDANRQAGRAVEGPISGEDVPSRIRRPIPFGPAIAVACWVTMMVGPAFTSWYLSLI
jgi:leader peptidase (prepilin peptidase)/N-methyltransferase